jgi:hypothetical protein
LVVLVGVDGCVGPNTGHFVFKEYFPLAVPAEMLRDAKTKGFTNTQTVHI